MALLEMKNISKQFFGVTVLHDVNLTVEKGTVHALLGENGAGKSTLMNILTGVYKKETGSVVFDGKELSDITIKKSEAAGIAFIHQELNPFNDLKVYENIFLTKEYINPFTRKLDIKRMIKESQALFDDLGVDIDAKAEVSSLTTGQKQLLEIACALHKNAELVILDEPTTALSNAEIDNLFRIVNELKAEGKTFIFVSHKMPEIFRLADDYTVFRNGYFVSHGKTADVTPLDLTRDIVGKTYTDNDLYYERELGEEILAVNGLTTQYFRDITLNVKKGEIIGLTGLQGAGSSEFLQTLFGAIKPDEGTIRVKGRYFKQGNIKDAMHNEIAMIASNRKENSIFPQLNLVENLNIAKDQISKNPQILPKKELANFNEYKSNLNIKCNKPEELITSLSGGNQQKVILARWLETNNEIILMDNPTQGIDVGAKEEIYKLILKLSEQGKTILFNTLEINEIKKVADRCVVFYHGHIEKILNHDEVNEETVMMYATNAHKVNKQKEDL